MSRGIPRMCVKKEQEKDSATALINNNDKQKKNEQTPKAKEMSLENPNGTAKNIENEAPKDAFDVKKALTMDLMYQKMHGGD